MFLVRPWDICRTNNERQSRQCDENRPHEALYDWMRTPKARTIGGWSHTEQSCGLSINSFDLFVEAKEEGKIELAPGCFLGHEQGPVGNTMKSRKTMIPACSLGSSPLKHDPY